MALRQVNCPLAGRLLRARQFVARNLETPPMSFTLPPLYGYVPPPSHALNDHARALYEHRGEAVIVPFVDVTEDGWQPVLKECHENCEAWCERHPEYELVRGWIYVPLSTLAYCRFLAHTVVRRPDGQLIDITPRGILLEPTPYQFLPTIVSRAEYETLALDLYGATGTANLDWRHGVNG